MNSKSDWFAAPRIFAVLAVALVLLAPCAAFAADPLPFPRTMYKPADIERAKQNIARHPWARQQWDAIRRSADYLLPMSREQLRDHISDKTGISHFKCPEDGQYFLHNYANFTDPGRRTLKCKNCGAEFTLDESAPEGFNVNSVIRSRRLAWVMGGIDAAAIAYQITGDRRYAEQASVLIERYAEVYKGYKTNNSIRQRWEVIPPDPQFSKVDGWGLHDAAIMRKVLLAYDLIHDSGVLTPEQITVIDRDLVAYGRDYYLAGYQNTTDPQGRTGPLWATTAIQDQGPKWWCLAAMGALLGDEKTLQLMVDSYGELLDPSNGFFYEDGTFFEGSADYTKQFMSHSLGTPEIIRGNLPLDIYSNPKCALLANCFSWFVDVLLPDGTIPAINDSHRGSTYPESYAEIAWSNYGNRKALAYLRDRWGANLDKGDRYSLLFRPPDAASAEPGEPYSRQSHHFPGMGLMILRANESANAQTMAWLDYGAYKPVGKPARHKHLDYMNIGLYAAGEEMLTEFGYSHDPNWYLSFQHGPWSHNTVMELARDQTDKGEALLWAPTDGAQMAEAGRAGKESRFLALLPRQAAPPLLVDIFRCDGLTSATWLAHARTDKLQIEGAGELAPVKLPHPFAEARGGRPTGDITATWTFDQDRSLRLVQLCDEATTFATAFSPPEEDLIDPLDYEETSGGPKPGVNPPKRAHLHVHADGADPIFVSVFAPTSGAPLPLGVEPLEETGDPGTIALRIVSGDETFIVIHNPAGGKAEAGGLALQGRAGVLALRAAQPAWLSIGGAKTVTAAGETLEAGEHGYASRRW